MEKIVKLTIIIIITLLLSISGCNESLESKSEVQTSEKPGHPNIRIEKTSVFDHL